MSVFIPWYNATFWWTQTSVVFLTYFQEICQYIYSKLILMELDASVVEKILEIITSSVLEMAFNKELDEVL